LQTARVGAPIKRQFSEVGSISRPRFTGWKEQQYGKKPEGSRVPTTAGRQGSEKKVVKRGFRADRVSSAPIDTDFGNGHIGTTIMMRKLQAQKYNGPFKITNHKKLRPGLYKFVGRTPRKGLRRIVMLEAYKIDKKPTKRIKWKSKAHNANSSRVAQREYVKQYKRLTR